MAREDEIRLIAYQLWEEEGCPDGHDCEHWYRAEAIWKWWQKPEAISKGTKIEPKQVTQPKTKVMAAKKKS